MSGNVLQTAVKEIASKADNKEDDKYSPVHQLPEPGLRQGTSAHSFETDQLQQVSSPAPAETCPVLLALVIGLLMPPQCCTIKSVLCRFGKLSHDEACLCAVNRAGVPHPPTRLAVMSR